jgi:hypothetical protein
MKRNIKVLVFSALMFGLQGAALSASNDSPFPASTAEANYNLPAIESYADRHARMGDSAEVWGVSKREPVQPHNPYPFGGGPVDD